VASIAEFQRIESDIRKGVYAPVYFLEGDEPYFIDKVAKLLEANVLTEAEKSFNFQVFYGKESSVDDVIMAAKRFPMMSKYQLIMVREAQYMKKLDALLSYLESPVTSTVLVFLYKGKKVSKATKLGKALKKCELFTSAKLYERDVMSWMRLHAEYMGVKIQPEASQLLLSALGSDLQKIAGELDKAKANLPEGVGVIGPDEIASGGTIDKAYNVFELTKTIGKRDLGGSLRIINYFNQNPKNNPFVLVLVNLFNYFKKVHMVHFQQSKDPKAVASAIGLSPYFVGEYLTAARNYGPGKINEVFDTLHEFDLRSKGMGSGHTSDGELLTELVVRLIQ